MPLLIIYVKMDNSDFHYFIIFDIYEDAMAMHDALDKASIENKISPAPLDLVEGVCCGVSLMIMPDDKEKLDEFFESHKDDNLKYEKIIKAMRSFKPNRDRYC